MDRSADVIDCEACEGKGYVIEEKRGLCPNSIREVKVDCSDCEGTGQQMDKNPEPGYDRSDLD